MTEGVCVWTWNGEDVDYWETECGEAFAFSDGGPAENRCKFCPYCGRKLVEVKPETCDDEESEAGV